ncbi:MAG: phosphoribosylformylglycinamidine synthase [Clostridiales bacterium]|jgi:phosphoribosylformylglycinamidine synthase|nr:phosphoribosylformylglycinamidine synthase [Clostridiales bacterium]
MNQRVFVEKKKGFDVEANALFDTCRTVFKIDGLTGVRVVNIYDVFGIDGATFSAACKTVFGEPPVDRLYSSGELDLYGKTYFAVEPLPGQYDQRGDSAEQCVRLLDTSAAVKIRSGKLIILDGKIGDAELDRVKKLILNPIESREKDLTVLLPTENGESEKIVPRVEGFISFSTVKIERMKDELGLAMNAADLKFVQDYFLNVERRDPYETEIRVLDTYWSDHCRHTTFETELAEIKLPSSGVYQKLFETAYKNYRTSRKFLYGEKEKSRAVTLMDIATVFGKEMRKKGLLPDLEVSSEINACSVYVDADADGKTEKWILQFKNETHNHPTEIEPFGGASTCIGGAIRDPLSGRSYVYQSMRVSGSGDPTVPPEETLKGKLPQRTITQKAAHGFSAYGNQIGLAATHISELYHEGYRAKRLEAGFVIGAVKAENIRREEPIAGDIVILLGGRTGRDGIGGATGSSKEHNETSGTKCASEVQKGNAPEERKIQRLFRRAEVTRLIKKCNDFGAGGVSVAIGELSDGVSIRLDGVKVKYDGLNGTELAISESQERMAVVVSPTDAAEFIRYAESESIEACAVAEITDDKRLTMDWNGVRIVNIRRDFLNTNGIRARASVEVVPPEKEELFLRKKSTGTVKERVLGILKDLNVASQKGLVEMFDNTIGASTVLIPFGGRTMTTPSDVSVQKLPIGKKTRTASIAAYGADPYLMSKSPFHGALYAVVESVAKVVAAGAGYENIRFTFQEYFERLGKNPKRWGKPFAALLGAYTAQREFGLPSIGGKDSMSGTFGEIDVPPTFLSFAVKTTDVDNIVSAEFKNAGEKILLYTAPIGEDGVIDFDALKKNFDEITDLIRSGKASAAFALRRGGIAEGLAKMSFGNKIGFSAKIGEKLDRLLYGGILVAVPHWTENGRAVCIGETTSDGEMVIDGERITIDEGIEAWISTLEKVFPSKKDADAPVKKVEYTVKERKASETKFAAPRVVIPAFYGTNCEYDSEAAFRDAGAEVTVPLIRTLNKQAIEESVAELAKKIGSAQILMLPGGFSAGDEPDGSAKYIANVLRNTRVADAVAGLLDRGGLILGICNGFQALIKSGLLPYGKIGEQDGESATLTYNVIGRHIAKIVPVRIASDKSPWFAGFRAGDLHYVAMSHGEGRLAASDRLVAEWIKNGQISAQYADPDGNPTMKGDFNPNGSVMAIEALCSPDGRILGKMGHNERTGYGLYKNICGDKNREIFLNGVKYFK